MPLVDLDGSLFHYAGEFTPGLPALLLCHGAGGSHRHWLYQMRGLQNTAAVAAVDLPGHGASAGEAATSITAYRQFIARFCRSLGLHHFILAGHSMGAAIALDYALHHGDNLSGLILVAGGARLRVAPPLLEACREGVIPPQLAEFAYGPAAPAELLESARQEMAALEPAIYYADFSACNSFDCMDRLDEIKMPVLLICGAADRMTPPRYSRYLKEQLPQAELVSIESAGHMAMLEAPQAVNEAIASFVKRVGGAGV